MSQPFLPISFKIIEITEIIEVTEIIEITEII